MESEEDNGEEGLFAEQDEDMIIEENADASEASELDKEGMVNISPRKEDLRRKAQERVEKLKNLKGHEISGDDLKEKLDVPAYLRKNVVLQNTPHSSENSISKYNLNDDNQILGNNRFLHDNVD